MYYLFSLKGKGLTPFIFTAADLRRFTRLVTKTFSHENIQIEDFIVRDGFAYFLFRSEDISWITSLLCVVCAGYGKYKNFTGGKISFEKIQGIRVAPSALKDVRKIFTSHPHSCRN